MGGSYRAETKIVLFLFLADFVFLSGACKPLRRFVYFLGAECEVVKNDLNKEEHEGKCGEKS